MTQTQNQAEMMTDPSQFGEDRNLTCVEQDCGQEFLFSLQEQRWYWEHGLKFAPKRCKNCRQRRREQKERD